MEEDPVEFTKTLMFWEEGSGIMRTENIELYKLEMSKVMKFLRQIRSNTCAEKYVCGRLREKERGNKTRKSDY